MYIYGERSMMCPRNVLFGYLPETVTVSGREFPINTDFRTWLTAGEIMRSNEAAERKTAKLIRLCYSSEKPQNNGDALAGALGFYRGAFPKYKLRGGAEFSADFDGIAIYSGFMKVYGIDLSENDMHWYRFAPLLSELNDCSFSVILKYRGADIPKIQKSARGFYAKMKSAFALPSAEKNTDFAQSLWETL